MYSKFENIDPLKQERIINASLKEFAEKRYNNASTNEIVKEAQISKGILFHYFENKKKLFLYIYDYILELFMKEFYEKIDMEEKDLFKKLEQLFNYKMSIIQRYPQATKFIEVAYFEDSIEIKEELDKRNTSLRLSAINAVFHNIDSSKFIEGIRIDQAINIVMYFFESYNQQQVNKSKLLGTDIDYDAIFVEANEYMQIFKRLLYKKEQEDSI